ncbi:SHOCT domain-containing protein [Blastococcus sp. URHD0036]|uniref:SHOCT domain-containing protein n=1 Tax=Blastococcus sp. URHD0036 TaxID=1380356 RepID=UPI0004979CCD|nr:SHOCT domain-containing protein [Blastococcus sp. URHD0036]
MSFWDVVWFIFISYVFIAYIMLLFHVIGDLFRDPDVGGFAKAVWVFALIFLPFLTVLVYVIARGKGMAARGLERAAAQQKQQDDYIRQVAGQTGASSPTDQIAQARALYDAGAISQPEYEALKSKALV